MPVATALYVKCQEFFTHYPLATRGANRTDSRRSMVLLLQEIGASRYFILLQEGEAGKHRYSLKCWHEKGAIEISTDDDSEIPELFVNALTNGVPVPRDGLLFGWRRLETIAALRAVYARYSPIRSEPYWSLMPLADIPESHWPPFSGQRFLGKWFWAYQRAGDIISLTDLIRQNMETVFWVDTDALLGSGCLVVAHDLTSPQGFTLKSGRYVHHTALRAGKPIPSLDVLLKGTKSDLAVVSEARQSGSSPNRAGQQAKPLRDHQLHGTAR